MYSISIGEQTRIFLYSFGLGFILGVIYDIFRITRSVISNSKKSVIIQDIAYIFVCCITTFLFILSVSEGKIRGFIFFGELIGWIVYYFSFGIFVVKISDKIIRFVIKTNKAICNIIIKPFKVISAPIIRAGNKLCKIAKNKLKTFHNKTKFLLKRNKLIEYNLNK